MGNNFFANGCNPPSRKTAPTTAAVWAAASNVAIMPCEDARLGGGKSDKKYPNGSEMGQAGWDYGVNFSNFTDLTRKLEELASDKNIVISRLALNIHGAPGRVDADCKASRQTWGKEPKPIEEVTYDVEELIHNHSSRLNAIGRLLTADAVVFFMSCNAGVGTFGDTFLMRLSNEWSGRRVVAFSSYGNSTQGLRGGGEKCTDPGMKDTGRNINQDEMSPAMKEAARVADRDRPWAWEESPSAKVALNGGITREPDDEKRVREGMAAKAASVVALEGRWNVRIGNWTGWFTFIKEKNVVFWSDLTTRSKPGRWDRKSGRVVWSFPDDDPPGWVREFVAEEPIKHDTAGSAMVPGKPGTKGFYTMSKDD